MPHIGLGGHIGPATRLGAVLVAQGHRVLAWAPERYRSPIEATGAAFQAHEPLATVRPFPNLAEFAAALAEATERCCGELIEAMYARGVDLVIHDVHVPWARVAADFLGLPRIVSDPLFPYRAGRLAGWASGAEAARGEDPWARAQIARSGVRRRWGVDLGGLPEVLNSRADSIVSFTTEEILGGVELPPGWSCVGPLMAPAPARVVRPSRSVVYVAFGTFFNALAESFRIVLDALAGEPVDIVVSTGRGSVTARDLAPLSGNAVVHEFVDSREVLARTAVHVTHGGGSSVHESLLAGVPMVCLPQGSDQWAWGQRVQELGAGRIVARDPHAIRSAVRDLLEDRAARDRAAQVGRSLAAYPGERRVAELVERTLGGYRPRSSADQQAQ